MKLAVVALAVALVLPTSAIAAPITINGVWTNVLTPVTDPGQGGAVVSPYWSGLSWDCPQCGVGYLVASIQPDWRELEYLHNGVGGATGFRFAPDADITDPTLLFQMTGWRNGVFGRRADGAFTYDSGTQRLSNSWDQGEQYALFRIVRPETTLYYLGIEDILMAQLNDHDYNDYVTGFSERASVPEPSSLLLLGCAFAAAGVRKAWGRKGVKRA